jgi:hypothetical protein
VAFHVQVRQSFHRAWRFNLEADELRRTVLEPWVRGVELTLGGRQWAPARADLRVLEGPRLEAADLAHGQGWNSAERSATDMTRRLIAALSEQAPPGRVAVVASPAVAAALDAALRTFGLEPVPLASVRASLVSEGARRAGLAAAVIHAEGAAVEAAGFDAGLAIGALGRRAVVVHGTPVDLEELRVRLEEAGVRPSPAPAS